MSKKRANLEQKLKNYNRKQLLSQKQERQLKRLGQKMRRTMREQQDEVDGRNNEWIGEQLDQKRILREVQEGS